MERQVVTIVIVVLLVFAVVHNPTGAAENVLKAGDAAGRILSTAADRFAVFINALLH